jgi:hypothetical protein
LRQTQAKPAIIQLTRQFHYIVPLRRSGVFLSLARLLNFTSVFNRVRCSIAAMNVREAKDFLVRRTEEQASLENVPLSALEKRMMYFTETVEMPEDPIELNTASEAEYHN